MSARNQMPSSKWKSNFREVQECLRWHSVRPLQWISGPNATLCTSCLQLQPLAPESSLSYSHLSHSVSSHLDSSPESSEAGADILLSRSGEMFKKLEVFWHIVSFLFYKESTSASPQSGSRSWRGSRTLWSRQPVDAPKPWRWTPCGYRLPPLPWTPRSRRAASLWARHPRGVCRCGAAGSRAPSSDTQPRMITCPAAQARGPACRWPGHAHITARPPLRTKHHVKWTLRLAARRGARALLRSLVKQWVSLFWWWRWLLLLLFHFFLLLHSQLPQSKTTTAQRFRPLDSTSDPHLHNNGHSQVPMLRPQYRGVPPLAKVRAPHSNQQTGGFLKNVTADGERGSGLPLYFLLSFIFISRLKCRLLHRAHE